MIHYQRTSKKPDVLLSRNELLVYMLCREKISEAELVERAHLTLDEMREVLSELQKKGLVEAENSLQVNSSQSKPKANSLQEVKQSFSSQQVMSKESDVSQKVAQLQFVKARVASVLESYLGKQAASYQQELESKRSLAEIEEWGYKLVIKLRLAVSQEAAVALETVLKFLSEGTH